MLIAALRCPESPLPQPVAIRRLLPRLTLLGSISLAAFGCGGAHEDGRASDEGKSTKQVRWWSGEREAEAVALEPRAVVDDLGRVWTIWIRNEPGSVALELLCSEGGRELARTRVEVTGDWIASPDLAPLGDGVLCVWEEGLFSDGTRRLSARTAEFGAGAIAVGDEESPLLGGALTPRLCRTGADRIELVAVRPIEVGENLGLIRIVRDHKGWSDSRALLQSAGDAWAPSLATDDSGRLHVAWDHFDGDRFRVAYAILDDGRELERHVFANGAGHQAHPSLALDSSGAAWIGWEEASQFGELGGLRGNRSLSLVHVEHGQVRWAESSSLPATGLRCDFPQLLWSPEGLLVSMRGLGPSFAASAQKRAKQASTSGDAHGVRPRSRVYIDSAARFYTTWWTRILTFDSTGSPMLIELPATEGDNLATETLLDTPAGPIAFFAADLRSSQQPRPSPFDSPIESPWRIGSIELPRAQGIPRMATSPPQTPARARASTPVRELRAELAPRDGETPVFFGDLHRHTHLSRCAGANDGTTTDVYRYARGTGGLDFVAITDHFQHLQRWSWWRNQRDVMRYHAPGRLVVFSGIERASKGRGHRNDIYLDLNQIEFDTKAWNDFPERGAGWVSPRTDNTISIPHMMGRSESPWRWNWFRADLHRLFEVYQGARGSYEGVEMPLVASDLDVVRAGVGSGLADGHQFGLIAASDHGASAAGLAGVYAAELTRESIFAALRARRSFAATDMARIDTQLGELRGGESGVATADAPFVVKARGIAPVAAVEVFKNGKSWRKLHGTKNDTELVVLTTRRWGPYSNNPMQILATDAVIESWRARRRGRQDLVIDGVLELSLVKGREPLDLVLELNSFAEDAALVLQIGDERLATALTDLPLDRTVTLDAPFDREQLWRIGPSLNASALNHSFEDPDRRPGDSYYARVVFEDGNIVWSSPIRVQAIAEPAESER